jgi:tetratricopeptide (TPR) repeat protein
LTAEGDAHYAQRAEGSRGALARAEQVELALGAYRAALRADAASVPARWRLLRALYFRATFCGATRDEARAFREEAKASAEEGVRLLERALGQPRGEARLSALRAREEAVPLYFWSAVSWGEWAQERSGLGAAKSGAAARIRDLAQTVIDLDPAFERGGGYRVLGRLHDRAPRVPFITGWVSHKKGVELLERSLAQDPDNSVSQLFLAEALLNHAPQRREEAARLLHSCAEAAPRPQYAVEDAYFATLARARLSALRAAR